MDWKNTELVLEEYAIEVSRLYKEKLTKNGHIATGRLLNSVKYEISKGDRNICVSLKLDEVWKWVENDCKPHFPPIQPLIEWVHNKFGGNPPQMPGKTYDGPLPSVETLENQFAHAVQHSIGVKGTEGTHDLQETLQQVNQRFEYKIGEAILQDLDDMMLSIITEFNMK